jgi:hypothetical protein
MDPKKHGLRMWAGFFYFRIGTSCRIL